MRRSKLDRQYLCFGISLQFSFKHNNNLLVNHSIVITGLASLDFGGLANAVPHRIWYIARPSAALSLVFFIFACFLVHNWLKKAAHEEKHKDGQKSKKVGQDALFSYFLPITARFDVVAMIIAYFGVALMTAMSIFSINQHQIPFQWQSLSQLWRILR